MFLKKSHLLSTRMNLTNHSDFSSPQSNHSIIFRDLKPENIGLDFNDNIKLFDFGLAKELKEEDRRGPSTYRATMRTGTQRYMAPEVFSSKGVYGLSADVYSLSLVIWQMLSLKIPFDGLSLEDHEVKVYQKGQRPKLRHSKWPEPVTLLIRDGWHTDPSCRPSMNMIFDIITTWLKKSAGRVVRVLAEAESEE